MGHALSRRPCLDYLEATMTSRPREVTPADRLLPASLSDVIARKEYLTRSTFQTRPITVSPKTLHMSRVLEYRIRIPQRKYR